MQRTIMFRSLGTLLVLSIMIPLNAALLHQLGDVSTTLSPDGTLSAPVTGKASYTGGNLSGGKCMLSTYQLPAGIFGTALSAAVWDSSYHCGECVNVTNSKGKSVTVMVVDICTPCEPTRLNLFQDAFAQLADLSKGIIDVTYIYVPCGISDTPLRLRNKAGTSAWWFSMQVLGADVPVQSLEVSTDGGLAWQPTTRQEYNFFENPRGFGADAVHIRVTGETGKSVVVHGVSMEPNLEVTASGNV
ncbi:extracellular cellulase CelA [Apiospora saccharicola]